MKNTKIIILFIFIVSFFIYCKPLLAASLQFNSSPKEIKVGDVFIVDVKLSSEKEDVNVADCVIFFDQDILKVDSISTGDSVFNLWTRSPIFSNESGKIMFTGGVPSGISAQEAQLIRVVFIAKSAGAGALVFSDESSIYLNDGQGTKAQLTFNSLNITVLDKIDNEDSKNEWSKLLANDKSAPEKVDIKLGRDESIFDNKFFISFGGEDSFSGIKSYEIKEGDGDFVVSESPYVLRDQSLNSFILVKVIDHAGNFKIVEFNPKVAEKAVAKNLYLLIIIILAVIIGFYIKKRKNAQKK
jgi:hypothetical protein